MTIRFEARYCTRLKNGDLSPLQTREIHVPVLGDGVREEMAAKAGFPPKSPHIVLISIQRLGVVVPKDQQVFNRWEAAGFLGESVSRFDALCQSRGLERAKNFRTHYSRSALEAILAEKVAKSKRGVQVLHLAGADA